MKKGLASATMIAAATGLPVSTLAVPSLIGILTALLGGGGLAQFTFGASAFVGDMLWGGGPMRCILMAL